MQSLEDTIVAPATPPGVSAIAVVRMSGKEAVTIADRCFSKNIQDADGYSMHYGEIKDGDNWVDEVVLSVFRSPRSYTGEDSVEISSHGSPYIVHRIVETLTKNGARMAEPGEFTLRAFLNQKLDLAQAEAVADMISSNNEAGLQLAYQQMKGGFSQDIAGLRQELVDFAALIELENDFGEEDVEFADRGHLVGLVRTLLSKVEALRSSFASGNALKQGIATVIAGRPNAGKSTLLNALLNEERAIVSDIAGTTRDTIEEHFSLGGVLFRLVDTAGIRESEDTIEQIGVSKANEAIQKAQLVIYLYDAGELSDEEANEEVQKLNIPEKTKLLVVKNKVDLQPEQKKGDHILVSAKDRDISSLVEALEKVASEYEYGNETMVTNLRHANALQKSKEALETVLNAVESGMTGDLIALDIRRALYELGLITGEVTSDDLLGSIFGRFCIGK
jgi:tRNA modification GTPase